MRYKTDIDKEYLKNIVTIFKNNVCAEGTDSFNKRSSVTRQGGRPYSYSPKEIGEQMIRYFEDCVKREQPLMVTGLCLWLGMSRQGMLKMEKSSKKELVDMIKKGKSIIELYLEMQSHILPNPAFPIFILKNMGWSEKEAMLKEDTELSDLEKMELQKRIDKFSE